MLCFMRLNSPARGKHSRIAAWHPVAVHVSASRAATGIKAEIIDLFVVTAKFQNTLLLQPLVGHLNRKIQCAPDRFQSRRFSFQVIDDKLAFFKGHKKARLMVLV